MLYKLQRSFTSVSPPPELYNKLFDTLVKPVALYKCEIWATDNVNRLIKYDSKKVYELSENDVHEYTVNSVKVIYVLNVIALTLHAEQISIDFPWHWM